MTVRRSMRHRLTLAMVTATVAAAPMACGYQGLSMPAQTAITLRGAGTLSEANPDFNPDTYNPALAPVGAQLEASMTPSPAGDSTTVVFTASGLLPNRGYAVHAHANACSGEPGGAGPHYQNRIDPAATADQPSTNPEYANPNNEIWLDIRTDAAGSATTRTTVPFVFTSRGPGSIVLHEAMQTATGPGHAGEAGDRLACLTLVAARPQDNTLLGLG